MSIKSFVLATSIVALAAGGAWAQSSGGGAPGIGGTTGGVGGTSGQTPVGPGSNSTNPNPTPAVNSSTGGNAPASNMTNSGMSGSRSGMSGSARQNSLTAMQPSQSDVKRAQTALKQKGLYSGPVDGQVGAGTHAAIKQYQQQNGLKQSAQLDAQTMDNLQGKGATGSSSGRGQSASDPSQAKPNSMAR